MRRNRQEQGFTLVEVLLAVTMMGVIMGAVVSSLFFMLQARKSAASQLDTSHDRQQVASYFTADVEGAAGTSAASTGSATVCGTTVSAVLVLRGTDYNAGSINPISTQVAYVWQAASGQLQRIYCRGSSSSTTQAVARYVTAAPTVSGSCTSTTSVTATSPNIALRIPETGGPNVVLCAHRRSA